MSNFYRAVDGLKSEISRFTKAADPLGQEARDIQSLLDKCKKDRKIKLSNIRKKMYRLRTEYCLELKI